MSTSGRWSPLEVGQSPAPQLLIKCDFNTDGYRVALTDLVAVWEESLNREQIFAKAERQRCSINPREAEDQLKILLDKISEALTRSKDTSLRVNKQQSEDDLTIVLSAPLPAPLPKLEWRIDLVKQGPQQLSDEIICPLLNRAYTHEQQIKQLTLHLREKDHVISRLLDRMEASNTDLTAIFPGVSNIRISRKASQRSQLAKYVKGLEPYEDVAYNTNADLPSPPPAQLLEILGTLPDNRQDGKSPNSRLGLGLPQAEDLDEGARTNGMTLQNRSLNAEDSETDEDMDDFQVRIAMALPSAQVTNFTRLRNCRRILCIHLGLMVHYHLESPPLAKKRLAASLQKTIATLQSIAGKGGLSLMIVLKVQKKVLHHESNQQAVNV